MRGEEESGDVGGEAKEGEEEPGEEEGDEEGGDNESGDEEEGYEEGEEEEEMQEDVFRLTSMDDARYDLSPILNIFKKNSFSGKCDVLHI